MSNVTLKIKSIAAIKNGATPSTTHPEYYGGDIVWLTPRDLSDQNTKYIRKGRRNITKQGLKNCSSTLLPKGTVLLSSRAPIGLLSIASVELCTNQGFKSLVVDKTKANNEFLYYLLKTKIPNFEYLGSKTTFKEITKTDLEEFEVQIPDDVGLQEKIAAVLSSLDDKIELNNRINAELEAVVKTLYDYWFVQFDFPDANGKPYKSSGGKMIYCDMLKRDIPAEWKETALADWIDRDKSGDWGKDSVVDGHTKKVLCIRGADINGLNGKETLNPPERYIQEKSNGKILDAHDIIIEISGGSPSQSTGRIAFITKYTIKRFKDPLVCSNFCKALTLKNQKLVYVFNHLWNSLYESGIFFNHEGKTSGIKNLLFDAFIHSYHTITPPQELVEEFYEYADALESKKQVLLEENQKLAELRDWLLPMLMNGQVTVT